MQTAELARLGVLIAGTFSVGYVPAAHSLKHVLGETVRFSHQQAIAKVVLSTPSDTLVLGSGDRFLMPFAARIWAEVDAQGPARHAWVMPSGLFFNSGLTERYASRLACRLAERDGDGVLWG